MKHTKHLSIALMVVALSCNDLKNEKHAEEILSFIPGTYIRAFEGQYSIGHDTLIISRPDERTNYYTIQHNSSYQKIRERQLKPLEYKSERWVAMFNEQDKVLIEQKKGKLISFLPGENSLLLGASRFNKIK